MSDIFRLEKAGDHFEIRRTAYPRFSAEVRFNNPYPRLRKLRLTEKAPAADLIKSKREAAEYLEFVALMGE